MFAGILLRLAGPQCREEGEATPWKDRQHAVLLEWIPRLDPLSSPNLNSSPDVFPSDASDFLRAHPFPGRSISDTFDDSTHRTGGATKRFLSALQVICGRTGDEDVIDDDEDDERVFGGHPSFEGGAERRPFYWSGILQQEFREELEK